MKDAKTLYLMAIVTLLCAETLRAQIPGSESTASETSMPGWDDFRNLSSRLTAVEAENEWLRREIAKNGAGASVMSQAGYRTACADSICEPNQRSEDCGWIDQVSDVCRERLSWNKGPLRIVPFGYVGVDMVASDATFTLPGAPLFLLPAVPAGIPDSRFSFTAQQTTIGLNITGPDLDEFQSGSTIAFNFFGNRPVQNNPGAFFLLGYVELKNEDWRIWAGQDADAIGRQNTNSPAWTTHKTSGNVGQVRPGFRAERFFTINDHAQTSLYMGLTQQVVLDFIANPQVAGTDNGWPNVEARWEVGMGPVEEGQRPLMLAVGGLIGETRAVDVAGRPTASVSKTWAVMPEFRIQCGCIGLQGEVFFGEAIGTYNGAIAQSLNVLTDTPIYSTGGFGEVFWNVNDVLTVAAGYGIDNPRDSDLAPIQRSRNESYWINAICRLSDQWEARCEVSHLDTDYIAPANDSESMIYQFSVRYYF